MLLEEIPVASPVPLEVITLQAGALTGDRLAGARQMAVDLPFAEQADLHTMQAAFGNADVLLDTEIEKRGTSPGWVDRNAQFAQWLGDNLASKHARRKQTGAYFLLDTSTELASVAAACGLTVEQVGEWLTAKGLRAVEQAPALGLYREALHDKLVNAGAPWESNDLTDLFYLTCAAGYVDYLACERETAAVLRQGSRDSNVCCLFTAHCRDSPLIYHS